MFISMYEFRVMAGAPSAPFAQIIFNWISRATRAVVSKDPGVWGSTLTVISGQQSHMNDGLAVIVARITAKKWDIPDVKNDYQSSCAILHEADLILRMQLILSRYSMFSNHFIQFMRWIRLYSFSSCSLRPSTTLAQVPCKHVNFPKNTFQKQMFGIVTF